MIVKRGDIYYADFSPVKGSEQGGIRPCCVISNNMGNKFSPTVIVAAITSRFKKTNMPTHVYINKDESMLLKDSVILLEQIRTIDKSRLKSLISQLGEEKMSEVDKKLLNSFFFEQRRISCA